VPPKSGLTIEEGSFSGSSSSEEVKNAIEDDKSACDREWTTI